MSQAKATYTKLSVDLPNTDAFAWVTGDTKPPRNLVKPRTDVNLDIQWIAAGFDRFDTAHKVDAGYALSALTFTLLAWRELFEPDYYAATNDVLHLQFKASYLFGSCRFASG